jgi:hypothetical protein
MTDRDLLISALTWAMRNLSDGPPQTSQSGWSGGDVIDWYDNREAARRILSDAMPLNHVVVCPADAEIDDEPTEPGK